jgi:hypothetical protein
MRAGAATVIDLAAYLGTTPREVRRIVAHMGAPTVGTSWKAKLYEPRSVIAHATTCARCQP